MDLPIDAELLVLHFNDLPRCVTFIIEIYRVGDIRRTVKTSPHISDQSGTEKACKTLSC